MNQSTTHPATPVLRSYEQERAAFAWQCASSARNISEYSRAAKAAPALIMSNGLMQTLAFMVSKKKEQELLAGQVCEWLSQRRVVSKGPGADLFAAVMLGLQKSSSGVYMQATDEALELLRWVRQFAAALDKA